jgi:universal stress protein A
MRIRGPDGRQEGVMTAIKTILVPIDFSDASRAALRYACTLADTLDASLHVFHATVNPYATAGYMEFAALPPELLDDVERSASEQLEASLTAEEKTKYRATLVNRVGAAAEEILRYLDEHAEIDLVVMATHGRGSVARLMLGSVTDKIVRSAPCPVLTIREPSKAQGRNAARSETRGVRSGPDRVDDAVAGFENSETVDQ